MRTFGQEVAAEVSNSTTEYLSSSYQDVLDLEAQLLNEISNNSARVAQQAADQALALDNARAAAQTLQAQNDQLEQAAVAAAAAAAAAAANSTSAQPDESQEGEELVPATDETAVESGESTPSEEGSTTEEAATNTTSTDSANTEEPPAASSDGALQPEDTAEAPASFLQLPPILIS